MDEIYKQCCSLAEDGREGDFIHPTRLLHFLVGMRAKNEPLAIGGPWSPSLDGADPVNDPRVLINTAIRTTKALTAIDLSACTQWYVCKSGFSLSIYLVNELSGVPFLYREYI